MCRSILGELCSNDFYCICDKGKKVYYFSPTFPLVYLHWTKETQN